MSDHSLNDAVKDCKLVQDRKRELNHRHKWALGEAFATPGHPGRRPASALLSATRRERMDAHGASSKRRHGLDLDADIFVSDSSTDEDVKDASAAPEPDADILYSYDAPRGPSQGGQILSMALAKAVEKFETKETEKLVKNEYEVVEGEKEDHQEGYVADEDDFEWV